ncbi:heat shock protein [Archangium gephyra]|uniref:Protease HtpX homolog n=1 Tax=Archangium gephyra TaxID=48 RepID=A0AAC8TEV9_9BACT|nr:zinc metalloprotease HtpX [Archangium gephyra]AKJ03327.1 Peptidase M48, Ste24p precursor [Archangium gephyra]REG22805.1 heat shock protein [Archangium gephyra]
MKNQIKTLLLLGVLSVVLIGIGAALGKGFLLGALVLSLAMNLGAYFYSDKLVLRMHGAQEVSPQEAPGLHRMVEELSARAGIPKPRVFLMNEAQPNAFATGRDPEHGVVAVTAGILEVLDERELRGVLAHELAHIKNRDILVSTIAAAVASAVTYMAHAVGMFGSMFLGRDEDEGEGLSPLQTLALALVAPLAATVIQLGISRSREYLADQTGGELSGDPEALASALRKLEAGAMALPVEGRPATASLFIVSPFAGMQSILSLFSTHPRTEERVRRLREQAMRMPAARGWSGDALPFAR